MIKRDDALKTVVKFTTPKIVNGKQAVSIGTGFFMYKDTQHLFLITANHVASEFNDNTNVSMSGKSNNVIDLPLKHLKSSKNVINHPSADISAIEINIQIFNGLNSDVVIYPVNLIDKNKIDKISRDEELTSIGFPNGFGVGTMFEPLSFRSFPASNIIKDVTLNNGYLSDIFFMENASCGGYSGCPVLDLGYRVTGLMTQTYPTHIYGVMHGTMSDNTGGKMAVVTPAYYILQII